MSTQTLGWKPFLSGNGNHGSEKYVAGTTQAGRPVVVIVPAELAWCDGTLHGDAGVEVIPVRHLVRASA